MPVWRAGPSGRAIAPAGRLARLARSHRPARWRQRAGWDGRRASRNATSTARSRRRSLGSTPPTRPTSIKPLIALDGTPNKARLGGNATIAVIDGAWLHAAAARCGRTALSLSIGRRRRRRLPLPQIQIFGGGAHAGQRVDDPGFHGDGGGRAQLRRGAGHDRRGLPRGRGSDEGARTPARSSGRRRLVAGLRQQRSRALEMLLRAIESAGYVARRRGRDLARHRGVRIRPRRTLSLWPGTTRVR